MKIDSKRKRSLGWAKYDLCRSFVLLFQESTALTSLLSKHQKIWIMSLLANLHKNSSFLLEKLAHVLYKFLSPYRMN